MTTTTVIPANQALPALCVIISSEPLLALEAVDALRERARKEGFTERHHFMMDGKSDWHELLSAGARGA